MATCRWGSSRPPCHCTSTSGCGGGRRFFKAYPFDEAFLLPLARQFRDGAGMPLMLLGGINRRETLDLAMAEGFEYVAMARALLREPDLVNRMQAGHATEGVCIHCNRCMPTIYTAPAAS